MLLFERFSAFFFNAETRVQIAFCVMVSCGLLSDFRADCALRECLILLVLRHWCSRRAALRSLVGCYSTFAQIAYCAIVSGGRLSDFRADDLLRYGRKMGGMRLWCRLRTALGSEDWRNEALVQIAYCVMVSCGLLSDFRADCVLR